MQGVIAPMGSCWMAEYWSENWIIKSISVYLCSLDNTFHYQSMTIDLTYSKSPVYRMWFQGFSCQNLKVCHFGVGKVCFPRVGAGVGILQMTEHQCALAACHGCQAMGNFSQVLNTHWTLDFTNLTKNNQNYYFFNY